MINKTEQKVKLGQFFTSKTLWLKPQVHEFIVNSGCTVAYDPFAGAGDLLNAVSDIFDEKIGLDIDEKLNWEINDSLVSIPHKESAIIITNPPYIAKQSATRRHIDLSKYFNNTYYDDIYLIALEKMLMAQKFVVAIIPESFINSNFKNKHYLSSITILEENPFLDTENPVCVACFDGEFKEFSKIKIYKNDKFVNDLQSIEDIRIEPCHTVNITFNTLAGWLGLRAIDSTDDKTFINFDFKENIDYDWETKIKVSSRHFSLIDINLPENKRKEFICTANLILNKLREDSGDVLLTPYMGNTKKGIRRRRLDFRLARAIMEKAYDKTMKIERNTQMSLFGGN